MVLDVIPPPQIRTAKTAQPYGAVEPVSSVDDRLACFAEDKFVAVAVIPLVTPKAQLVGPDDLLEH